MKPRIIFVRCSDCGGRGHIPIRIEPYHNGLGGYAGGGAIPCGCAGGYRAVVARRPDR